MSAETPASKVEEQKPLKSKSRLWLWFLAGFLLTFIALLFVLSMDFYNGRAVSRTALWHYYFLEFQLAWNSTGHLGPTSDNSSAALTVVLQHILLSSVGGGMLLTAGWLVRKRTRHA